MGMSSTPAPRQTLNYLRGLLAAHGLRPNAKRGQCFLIDINFLDFLVRAAELTGEDLVLEVGSGTGSLTNLLSEQAGFVLGVELDPGFYQLARENTAGRSNVLLLHGDILAGKNRLNPGILESLAELRQRPGLKRLKLVSNLPYAVATPVIANLLLTNLPFERLLVTIQWELAERLAAQPGTAAYGAVSVLVQSLADVAVLRRMPPTLFWPRPRVDSALVLIRPRADKRARIRDLAGFHRFLHNLYLHRRKKLRVALAAGQAVGGGREALDRELAARRIDPHARAESLTVEEHLRLYEALAPGA